MTCEPVNAQPMLNCYRWGDTQKRPIRPPTGAHHDVVVQHGDEGVDVGRVGAHANQHVHVGPAAVESERSLLALCGKECILLCCCAC